MRSLLVTGGAGFIGANFVNHWVATAPGDRLVVLDSLSYAGNLANLRGVLRNPALRFVHGDIGDTALVQALLREERVDTVVHFAAESHVDRSIAGPDLFVTANVVGTHSLLKAARQAWLVERIVPAHRFHHVSTDEVYGSLGPDEPRFSETTPYSPNSPYSASKAASDHLVNAYHHTYGLQTSISNCSNNYGPFQFPEKLIPLILTNALQGRALPVYGDGLNVRDWLHVSDHCVGLAQVLERGRPGETYNLGGNAERANIDLVKALCGIVDGLFRRRPDLARRFPACPAAGAGHCESLIEFVKDRPGHDRRYAVDTRKAERELGFRPAVDVESGLASTVEWYVDNEWWWRTVLSGQYRAWDGPGSLDEIERSASQA
jgi:dTDP-glucose 4,6-dehydratase